ncbi:hypothetical protein QTP88_012905 [Uroleucon formosanum]
MAFNCYYVVWLRSILRMTVKFHFIGFEKNDKSSHMVSNVNTVYSMYLKCLSLYLFGFYIPVMKIKRDTLQKPPKCRCIEIAYTPCRPMDKNKNILKKYIKCFKNNHILFFLYHNTVSRKINIEICSRVFKIQLSDKPWKNISNEILIVWASHIDI